MGLAELQLIGITLLLGWAFGALAVALWMPVCGLDELEPRARIRRALAALALPAAAALFLGALVFSPSVFHAAGVAADHCEEHSHHAFHLCLVHGNAPLSVVALALLLAVAAPGLIRLGSAVRRMGRMHGRLRSLVRVGRVSNDVVELDSEQPLVFTAGYLRPRVVMSRGLREMLDEEQLAVVLAHENHHAAHRDGLLRLVAALLAVLVPLGTARRLCREIERAGEEAADAAAAVAVGSSVAVAETLLRVERLLGAHGTTSVGFADGDLRHRVGALLEGRPQRRPSGIIPAAFALIVVAAVLHVDPIHHAVESLVAICL